MKWGSSDMCKYRTLFGIMHNRVKLTICMRCNKHFFTLFVYVLSEANCTENKMVYSGNSYRINVFFAAPAFLITYK